MLRTFYILLIVIVLIGCNKNRVTNDNNQDVSEDIFSDGQIVVDVDSIISEGTMTEYGYVHFIVEKRPRFGNNYDDDSLFYYLGKKTIYPQSAIRDSIQGKVFIAFIIDERGIVLSPEVLRGLSEDIDKECIRVVQEMPLWTPGEIDGKPVKVKMVVPITFHLDRTAENNYVKPKLDTKPTFDFDLYPNPALNFVNVTVVNLDYQYNYKLLDSNGRLLKSGQIDPYNTRIDLENLASGTYFFQLVSREAQQLGTKRLIIR